MRWIWIDRFVEFNSRKSARAIKNISLAEDHLHDHFPGFPVMPNSLITEGLAQTGGLLVGEASNFDEKVILAKIPKAVFHFPAVPGDTLLYTAKIEQLTDTGAMVSATCHVLGRQLPGEATATPERLQAEMEIVFAYLRDDQRGRTLFEPKNFVFTMKLLGVFDVGRAADGSKLQEPPGLTNLKTSTDEEKIGGG
jgi:3-hydroxyacyl-[acyl-carrier-protein] dehydratase